MSKITSQQNMTSGYGFTATTSIPTKALSSRSLQMYKDLNNEPRGQIKFEDTHEKFDGDSVNFQQESRADDRLEEMILDKIQKSIEPYKEKIMKRVESHNQRIVRKTKTIAPHKVQACISQIEQRFPKITINYFLRALSNIVQRQNHKKPQKTQKVAQVQEGQQYYPLGYNIKEPTQAFLKAKKNQQMSNNIRKKESFEHLSRSNLKDEQIVAISYLNHGYGVRTLRQFIKDDNMTQSQYHNFITIIMKNSFKKLEKFILNQGNMIVPINWKEEQLLRPALTNCQKWMPQDELEVFFQLIKWTQELETGITLPLHLAIRLYNNIIKQLKQRQIEVQGREKKTRRKRRKRKVEVRDSWSEESSVRSSQQDRSQRSRSAQVDQRQNKLYRKGNSQSRVKDRSLNKVEIGYRSAISFPAGHR